MVTSEEMGLLHSTAVDRHGIAFDEFASITSTYEYLVINWRRFQDHAYFRQVWL